MSAPAQSPPALDPMRTDSCPLGHRCEACGIEAPDVDVYAVRIPRGVLCLTMCPRCGRSRMAPPIAPSTAVRLVAQHCAHLGVDAARMTAPPARARRRA